MDQPDSITGKPGYGLHARVALRFYSLGGMFLGFFNLPLIPFVRWVGLPRDASAVITLFGLMPLMIFVLGVRTRGTGMALLGTTMAIGGWGAAFVVVGLVSGFNMGTIAFSLARMGILLGPLYFALTLIARAICWGRQRRLKRS